MNGMHGIIFSYEKRNDLRELGENCRIGADSHVGGTPESAEEGTWGLTVLAPNCTVESGRQVRPGVMLGRNGEEVSK